MGSIVPIFQMGKVRLTGGKCLFKLSQHMNLSCDY